jgi:hypothetical protein
VCVALAEGLGEKFKCAGGHYSSEDTTIDVYTIDRDKGFVRIDFKIVAKSMRLSGYVGKSGYESHAFEALLFAGFDCMLKYWITFREPRFMKGPWRVASDPGNPNWTLYTDGDRLTPLRDRVQNWFVQVFDKGDEK